MKVVTDKIIKYAHVAEIIDRIAIEILKVHEFSLKARTSVGGAKQDWETSALEAGETASFQEGVLRDRLRVEYPDDGNDADSLANILIRTIHITVGASIVSQYENMKRGEHGKKLTNGIAIAVWDGISRDACELRGNGKSLLNRELAKFLPGYEYPVEGRTF
jgi:hypothetical protein